MCGEVRFEAAAAPKASTVCYCHYCRKAAGAMSVAWLTFAGDQFCYTKGRPAEYNSSPGVTRTFCPRCGTSLTYINSSRPEEIDVTTAAMDAPEAYPPRGIVFPDRKVSWDRCLEIECDK